MSNTSTIILVSDAKVSNEPTDVLTTYALGSCIAVCLHDATTRIGGMLHYQLPDSKLNPERAKQQPCMFADTGLTFLVKELTSMGADKKNLKAKIAGGAAMDTGPKGFDIGKRNYLAVRKILWEHRLFLDAKDIGGSSSRNMYLNIDSGEVTVRSGGLDKSL